MDQQQIMRLCDMEQSLCRLIGLYCMQHPSEKEIAGWFAGIEFEALRPEASCMAAAMAVANDYKGVPLELIPRLRGILRYVHTLNSGMTAGLCVLGKQLNEAGIPAVLLGSTAVHLGYPEPPRRHIWQMQISISETSFPRATELAAGTGFAVEQTPYSAIARCGNTQCVLIHKGMEHAREAMELTVNGTSFLMLCSTQLLVDMAEAVFQALSTGSGPKLIPWIMDLRCVLASTTDWKAVAAAATERGTAGQVRLVLELYNSLASNILDGGILNLFGTEDTVLRLAQLLLEYRKLKPGKARLKRLWLSTRIKNGTSLSATMRAFIKELYRAGTRKLTQGS